MPTRVAQAIPENINLTFRVESRGKSMSMPLGTGQRSEGGNIILRVSLGSRCINWKLYQSESHKMVADVAGCGNVIAATDCRHGSSR